MKTNKGMLSAIKKLFPKCVVKFGHNRSDYYLFSIPIVWLIWYAIKNVTLHIH